MARKVVDAILQKMRSMTTVTTGYQINALLWNLWAVQEPRGDI